MWTTDQSPIPDLLSAAVQKREVQAAALGLEAYRLINGPGDGAPPGLQLDRYGPYLVLGARSQVPEPTVQAWIQAVVAQLAPVALIRKTWPQSGEGKSETVHGPRPEGPVTVREGDAVFLVDLDAGVQTGLFLDQRETRFAIRPYAAGVEVLNLFAYTCSFSVHAALAGAQRVTSVDVAKRALERGRENMRASGLDPDRHRWFGDDVLRHVGRASAPRYGLVIADPPVLGRAKGATFSLLRDLDRLAAGLLERTAEGGVLVFSTHALELSPALLEQTFARHAAERGRTLSVVARLGLPAFDHPLADRPDPDDRGDYLSTLVLRVG